MEFDVLSTVAVIIITLIMSAFFSGMEVAFLSSNKLKMELDKKQNSLFSRVATLFSSHSGEYMTTILIGNNIALVVFSLEMSILIGHYTSLFFGLNSSVLIDTLISTVIIIFFAEYLPKSIVKSNPNFYFRTLYAPVYVFYLLFYPLSIFSTFLSAMIMKMFGINIGNKNMKSQFNKGDLAHLLVEASSDKESFSEDDKDIKIFQNALDFSDLRVRDCMVHRVDIESLDCEASVDQARQVFEDTKYSRLPVHSGSVDNIIGYINLKDLFTNPGSIKEMLHSLIYIPESYHAQKLLATFIKNKSSIAVVIDEFGGTAGMITIEDILEEIFGEIEDEYDSNSLIEKKIKDNVYVFSGRLEVSYLNEKYDLGIPELDDYDTLAGYIIFDNDGFPKPMDEMIIGNIRIKILKMDASKIELIKLKIDK